MRRAAGPPAHDAPGIAIDDKGHIDKALPCRDISKIRDPQDIRAWRLELAVDAVQRTGCGLVADRCLDAFATNNSLQSRGTQYWPASAAPRCSAPHPRPRASTGAKPCARHKRGSSPRRHGESRPSRRHPAWSAPVAFRDRRAWRHDRGRWMGRSATPCRSTSSYKESCPCASR